MFRILVVDDDKNTRLYMRAFLEAERYTVFLAGNGEEALDMMEKEHIDLVILDIMMPKMDGYEFTRELRSVNNDLPILMVSAKQLPEDRKLGYKLGTNDFMVKPVDQEELLLRVKNLLRMAKIASPSPEEMNGTSCRRRSSSFCINCCPTRGKSTPASN